MSIKKHQRRVEAGRKGGAVTRDRYGQEFYAKIGRMGGRKGGETTKQRYGTSHYQRIGRIGGASRGRSGSS